MTITLLELYCLNSLCDDYENIDSIKSEVRNVSHGNLTSDEILNCLKMLFKKELISVYELDQHSQFLPSTLLNEDAFGKKWFLITDKGREELDKNWIN